MTAHNYIDNKAFLAAIVARKADLKEAKKLKKPKPRLSDYLGQCILLIAQNLSNLPRFAKYPHKEEMIGDGIENCILYFDNFNLKYKNPHNYFSKIAYWAFVRRIQKEKKQLYAKYKLHEQMGVLSQIDGVSDEAVDRQFHVYDNIADFIKTYEEKAAERKAKVKPKNNWHSWAPDKKKKLAKKKAKKKAIKRRAKKKARKRK